MHTNINVYLPRSNIPHYLPGSRSGYRLGHQKVVDGIINDGLWDLYNDQHMGTATYIQTFVHSTACIHITCMHACIHTVYPFVVQESYLRNTYIHAKLKYTHTQYIPSSTYNPTLQYIHTYIHILFKYPSYPDHIFVI